MRFLPLLQRQPRFLRRWLSQAGFRITIIDRGERGGEASWAGAEMLAPAGNLKFTAVSVEVDTGLVMTHEFVHVVNAELAHLSPGWRRTIAHTIFTEGLAMRATQSLQPWQPDGSRMAAG
jgi:glycine/D-amino acid oxidase-like deaminating enzyme